MSDFKAKMHQIRFRLGLCPRPHWESLQRSPRPLSWIWGGLLLREGMGGKGGSEGGEGRGGKRGEKERGGEGWEGRGEEAFLVMWPRRLSALNPPMNKNIVNSTNVKAAILWVLSIHTDKKNRLEFLFIRIASVHWPDKISNKRLWTKTGGSSEASSGRDNERNRIGLDTQC